MAHDVFDSPLFPVSGAQRRRWTHPPLKPMMKWTGSKRKLVPELIKRLPDNYLAYHEPFLGGGSLFFYLRPERAYLYDANPILINTYRQVRDRLPVVLKRLSRMAVKDSKKYFYYIRKRTPGEKNRLKQAAYYIYLNRNSFRGYLMTAKDGHIDSMFSPSETLSSLNIPNIERVSMALQDENVRLINQSFEKCRPHRGHFYYFDPPYFEMGARISYSSGGFGVVHHEKLARLCHRIDRVGGYFLLSNSNSPEILDMFSGKGYNIGTISVKRNLSRVISNRKTVLELLISNY